MLHTSITKTALSSGGWIIQTSIWLWREGIQNPTSTRRPMATMNANAKSLGKSSYKRPIHFINK